MCILRLVCILSVFKGINRGSQISIAAIKDIGACLGTKFSMARAAINKRSSPIERVHLIAKIWLFKLRFGPF